MTTELGKINGDDGYNNVADNSAITDMEAANILQYEYNKTGKWWIMAQWITGIIFFTGQCILASVYPALAACIAPLVALQFAQLLTSLRWIAMRETLVLNKSNDSVTATFFPNWGPP